MGLASIPIVSIFSASIVQIDESQGENAVIEWLVSKQSNLIHLFCRHCGPKHHYATLFVLLAAVCLMQPGVARADKIYAIGDSITRGFVFNFDASEFPMSAYRLAPGGPPNNIRSYREHLHDRLTQGESCDANVDWVGSKDEPGRTPVFHEGRSGWRADEINNRRWRDDIRSGPNTPIDGWLGVYNPDHILIHLGTNDMQQGQTAQQTRDDIEVLLNTIQSETPGASVHLANVIPIFGWWANHINLAPTYQPDDRGGEAALLSSLIEQLVSERQASGEDIHLVDVRSDFFVDTSDVTNCATGAQGNPLNMSTSICKDLPDGSGQEPDGIHPNVVGDKFIADKFFESLSANTSLCSITTGDTSAPSVDVTTPSSSGEELPSVATLEGTAADPGGSGFNGVELSVLNSNGDYLNFATGTFSTSRQSTDASLSNTDADSTDWSVTTPGLPNGSYTVEVTATDSSGNESPEVSRAFVVDQSGTPPDEPEFDTLFVEAESGILGGAMAIVADGSASSGSYVVVADGGASSNSSLDYVEFPITFETAGEYEILAGVRGPNGSSNSFFAQLDGGSQYLWDTPKDNVWTTDKISDRGNGDITVNLDAGLHTLRISLRETGTQLDFIEFVLLNPEAPPVDDGDTVAPTVEIASPGSIGELVPAIANLSGSASDSGGAGFGTVDVSVRDGDGNYLNFGSGAFTGTPTAVPASLSNTSVSSTNWSITTPELANGSYTVSVTSTDAEGNASQAVSRGFVVDETTPPEDDPPVVGGGLFAEAESGLLSGGMNIAADAAASSGNYVSVDVGSQSVSITNDYVELSVTLDTAGEYEIQGRVRGPNGGSNSFFAQIDGGVQYLWDTPKDNVWTTDVISNRGSGDVTFNLDAGVHTLRVSLRETGTQLDYVQFVLLNEVAPPPVDDADIQAPVVAIESPAFDGEELPSVAILSGSATDQGGAGFDRVFVSIRNSSDLWLDFSTGTFSNVVGSVDANLSNSTVSSTDWSVITLGLADDSYVAQVTAVDSAGNISTLATRSFVVESVTDEPDDEPTPPTALYQEAESAFLSGGMAAMSDSVASNGSVVSVPDGAQSSDTSLDYVEFTVNIDVAGDYRILAGVRGPTGSKNSFFVQMDGGTQYRWDLPRDNVLTDVLVSGRGVGVLTFALDAGIHTFRASYREEDSQLDYVSFQLQSDT